MEFVEASWEHADGIVKLLNESYRTQQGWTNEFGLVTGDRATQSMIETLLDMQSVTGFLFIQNNNVIGCIFAEHFSKYTEIGTFAINPRFQNNGLGRRLLALAEHNCVKCHNTSEFRMSVLSYRIELIDFYLRCGYSESDFLKPYPIDENVGVPMLQDLSLVVLLKVI